MLFLASWSREITFHHGEKNVVIGREGRKAGAGLSHFI